MIGILRRWATGLLLAALIVQPGAAAAKGGTEQPAGAVARFGFAPEDVGFLLKDARTGAVLAAHASERLFIPASVAKIPTAVAALDILGPQHRFTTTLHATGTVAGGTLKGDLCIRGGGDPFLETADLDGFVAALQEAGVERVDGRFCYDLSYLPAYTKINPLQPDAAVYNPGVAALSLNFNRVELRWQRQKEGDFAATVRAISSGRVVPLEAFSFTEAPESLRSGAMFAHAGEGDENEEEEGWLFAPSLPDKGYAWLPVRDPGLVAAQVLRARAAEAGVVLPEPVQGVAPDDSRLLHRHVSPPLSEILQKLLKYSNNLTAELVGLTTARTLAGEPVEVYAANRAAMRHVTRKIAGVDWDGFAPGNFSGLNSYGRVSPAQLVAILDHAEDRSWGDATLADLLKPVAIQESVTVVRKKGKKKRKVTETKTIGSARVKTGTMAYARGLAGYIRAASGRRLIFAYFANDLAEREALDRSAAVRSVVPPPASRRWLARARALENHLLLTWAKAY